MMTENSQYLFIHRYLYLFIFKDPDGSGAIGRYFLTHLLKLNGVYRITIYGDSIILKVL